MGLSRELLYVLVLKSQICKWMMQNKLLSWMKMVRCENVGLVVRMLAKCCKDIIFAMADVLTLTVTFVRPRFWNYFWRTIVFMCVFVLMYLVIVFCAAYGRIKLMVMMIVECQWKCRCGRQTNANHCWRWALKAVSTHTWYVLVTCSVLLDTFLWSPYVIGQTIIFLPCDFYLASFFFSSPNLSGRRLDVYHTSTHGVALVRI